MKQEKYVPFRTIARIETEYPKIYEKASALNVEPIDEFEAVMGMVRDDILRICNQRGISMQTDEGVDFVGAKMFNDTIFVIVSKDWIKSKQVYSFSKEFCDMLYDMDDFEIDANLFDYLPFNAFYLEIPNRADIHGVLAKYTPQKQTLMYTVCYNNFAKRENIVSGEIDFGIIKSYHNILDELEGVEVLEEEREKLDEYLRVIALVLQSMMYLCSTNSDVEENPEQKKIYKPSTTVRNKFSELRKWDVGYRVVREHAKAKKDAEEEAEEEEAKEKTGERKRPRMHWRKAHWHTYLCGKGKTERRVKFVAPVLVNEMKDDELPVVNHVK